MAKKIVNLTTLFVDIVDSIELANYWDVTKYNDFVDEFQFSILNTIRFWADGIREIKIAGDELIVFYCSGDISSDIANAICLANNLKIGWYASHTNLKRIKEGKKILDLGIGINTGKVVLDKRYYFKEIGRLVPKKTTYEGFAISLAKRIESFSRQGKYSKIMLGQSSIAEFKKLYHNYEFEYVGLQKFKGLAQEIPIFELKSCYSEVSEIIGSHKKLDYIIKHLEKIINFDPSNIWLYTTLIDIYSQKQKHKKVEALCKEAISIDNTVANIHFELASSLLKQRKYEESLSYINRAINLRPNLWYLYETKETSLVFLGRYDEAIEICRFVIDTAPRWYLKRGGYCHYYNIAAAYARKNNIPKALVNIKKAVKLGGVDVRRSLKKDEDKDFLNLLDNQEFKIICQARPKNHKTKDPK